MFRKNFVLYSLFLTLGFTTEASSFVEISSPLTRVRNNQLQREMTCPSLSVGEKVEALASEKIAGVVWIKIHLKKPGCPSTGYIAESNTTLVRQKEGERLVVLEDELVNDEIADEVKYLAGQGRSPRRKVLAQSRGLYRFPILQNSSYVSACGAFHYLPDDDLVDVYVHKKVGCGFLNFLQDWQKEECQGNDQGCRVAFGDISHKTDRIWNGHKTHTNGQCVDMRPLRKGEFKNEAVWWCEWKGDNCSGVNPDYDRDKTEKLVRFLKAKGATKLLFNDPVLINKGLTQWSGGHDNHIHACFYSNSSLDRLCRGYSLDENSCPLLAEGKMR